MLHFTGALTIYSKKKLDNRGLVLMYHRVLEDAEQSPFPLQPGMYVRKASFEAQMSFLQNHFIIISLQEMVCRLEAGEDMTRCCSITFDDGWKDNYEVAFPVLKRLGIPTTIFLTTGYIGTDRWFWPDEFSWCLSVLWERNMMRELPREIGDLLPRKGSLEQVTDTVIEGLKLYHPDERDDLVRRIRSLCPGIPCDRLMMNWSEARTMLDSGVVAIGSHTVEHQLLHQLEPENIDREIATSREDIQRNLHVDATLFAYPNGDFNQVVKTILANHGFSGAVTTMRGYVTHATPKLEIPRISIHDDVSNTPPLFYSRILLNSF